MDKHGTYFTINEGVGLLDNNIYNDYALRGHWVKE